VWRAARAAAGEILHAPRKAVRAEGRSAILTDDQLLSLGVSRGWAHSFESFEMLGL
jgi:hypothetical protein